MSGSNVQRRECTEKIRRGSGRTCRPGRGCAEEERPQARVGGKAEACSERKEAVGIRVSGSVLPASMLGWEGRLSPGGSRNHGRLSPMAVT